jgi:4-hydroxybenzoate polyprenyltransferase
MILVLMNLVDIINTLRPQQSYKNLVIFAALFFSSQIFNLHLFSLCLTGFFVLIINSSCGYIINDLIDIKLDRKNPEKCFRPIASGKVSNTNAILFVIFLALFVLILLFAINNVNFAIIVGFLFILSVVYSLFLKKLVFADIICISVIFVMRAVSGAILINAKLSPWFLLGILSLAFFLVSAKRYGELYYFGNKASSHRPVLSDYNLDILNGLMVVFMTSLVLLLGLFAHFTDKPAFFLLYPIYLYLLFSYYKYTLDGDIVSRHAEKIIYKKAFMFLLATFVLLTTLLLYIENIWKYI